MTVTPVAPSACEDPTVGARDLTTERLTLSRPRLSDAAQVFAVLGDPRTVEHNPSDRLETHGESAELVTRWIRHWEEHGFGYWCVRERSSERVIGYAGVKRMTLQGRPVVNLVYRFVPEEWGQGYATEAAAAIVAQLRRETPTESIVARVRPDNLASQNVALKVGLKRDAELDCQGEDGPDWVFSNR